MSVGGLEQIVEGESRRSALSFPRIEFTQRRDAIGKAGYNGCSHYAKKGPRGEIHLHTRSGKESTITCKLDEILIGGNNDNNLRNSRNPTLNSL